MPFIPTDISSKRLLILTVSGMIIEASEPQNMNFSLYDVSRLSLDSMSILFNLVMQAFPEQQYDVYRAIKKYYSPNSWFKISEEAQKIF